MWVTFSSCTSTQPDYFLGNPASYQNNLVLSQVSTRLTICTLCPSTTVHCYNNNNNNNTLIFYYILQWCSYSISFIEYMTSINPCTDIYGGLAPESEVETNNIMEAVNLRANNLQISVDLHSFGQLWLLPYGGDPIFPDDYDELVRDDNTIISSFRAIRRRRIYELTIARCLFGTNGRHLF